MIFISREHISRIIIFARGAKIILIVIRNERIFITYVLSFHILSASDNVRRLRSLTECVHVSIEHVENLIEIVCISLGSYESVTCNKMCSTNNVPYDNIENHLENITIKSLNALSTSKTISSERHVPTYFSKLVCQSEKRWILFVNGYICCPCGDYNKFLVSLLDPCSPYNSRTWFRFYRTQTLFIGAGDK